MSIELNKYEKKVVSENFALITKICYGVLEKDITLEYIIHKYAKKVSSKEAMLVLKIGTYIGKYLNSIPNYTIVNECVNLIKKSKERFLSGFVNATLKNILNGKVDMPNTDDKAYDMSIRYSVPYCWVQQFIKSFGLDFTQNMLSTTLTTLTHIRILKDINSFYQICDKEKIEYKKTAFSDTCYIDYQKLRGVKSLDSAYVVQGLPSIITARNFAPNKEAVALDMCSAPGGKTMLLADATCRVVACDIYPHRLDLVKSYAQKLGKSNINCVVADATKFNKDFEGKFDYILCDVPCSGLGVVTKKPDIYLSRTLDNVKELNAIQTKILDNACRYLKPNGTIIYSTCSILPAENEDIVKKFLDSYKDFKSCNVNTFGVGAKDDCGMKTFYPHISGTEGFFIAKLERK